MAREAGEQRKETRRRPSLYRRARLAAMARAGLLDRLQIVPFRGFGNGRTFVLEGRLIEAKGIAEPTDHTTLLENVLGTLRRFESDEIPDACIRARFRGRTYETQTDTEGYFSFRFDAAGASRPGWHQARLQVVDSIARQEDVTATGSMLLPSPCAEYLIVSDIDDTILQTGAFDRTTMARMTLSKNARTRTPFPGVARLYRELEKGRDGRGRNPVFYLSRSGWNLYDVFESFLEYNDLPRGPILLRDIALIESPGATPKHEHKVRRIGEILKMYPRVPLLLIGDSGQEDPQTYERIVRAHPSRIRAVYLRDVTRGKRDEEVAAIVRRIGRRGIAALATDDTLALAVHAAAAGLLRSSALERIRAAQDEALRGAASPVFRR